VSIASRDAVLIHLAVMSARTAEPAEGPTGAADASERDEPLDADLLALACAVCGHPHRTTRPTCAECGSARLLASMHCSIARRDATTTPPASFAFVAIPVSIGIVFLAALNWLAYRNGWTALIVTEIALATVVVAFAAIVTRSAASRARWRRLARRWGGLVVADVLFPAVIISLLFAAVALSLERSTRLFSVLPIAALLAIVALAVHVARHGSAVLIAPFRRMTRRRGAWQHAPMRAGRPVPISEIVEIRQAPCSDPRALHIITRDGWIGDVEVRETAERARRITALLRIVVRRQRALDAARAHGEALGAPTRGD
jgi:hypothetical protein